jgi:hypothetical protein
MSIMKLFPLQKLRKGRANGRGEEKRKYFYLKSDRIVRKFNLRFSLHEKRGKASPARVFIQRNESFMTVTAAENDFLGYVSFCLPYVGMNARRKGVV